MQCYNRKSLLHIEMHLPEKNRAFKSPHELRILFTRTWLVLYDWIDFSANLLKKNHCYQNPIDMPFIDSQSRDMARGYRSSAFSDVIRFQRNLCNFNAVDFQKQVIKPSHFTTWYRPKMFNGSSDLFESYLHKKYAMRRKKERQFYNFNLETTIFHCDASFYFLSQ